MLHTLIKSTTEVQHLRLEQLMHVQEIMNGSLNPDQYRKILQTNYIVHLRFEERIHSFLSDAVAAKIRVPERAKLKALEKDMEEAGLSKECSAGAIENQTIKDEASALGAMYVLEGATLGGSVIVRKLKDNPRLMPLNLNYHYYQVYGKELGSYWNTFIETLNAIPEKNWNNAVQAATMLFDEIYSCHKKSV